MNELALFEGRRGTGRKESMTGKYWDEAWSLVEGCTPVSPGCEHCWAESMGRRFKKWPKKPRFRGDRLEKPTRTPEPTIFQVWNDLFHENVKTPDIMMTFEMMSMPQCSKHRFIVCTKRPERMAGLPKLADNYGWDCIKNTILMTSAENQYCFETRLVHLLKCKPFKIGLSIEPILERIKLYIIALYNWIDWVIVGGETGPGARPMDPDWARRIRDDCRATGVPFYFKSMGSSWGKKEIPEDLRIREMPEILKFKDEGRRMKDEKKEMSR